MDNQDTHNTEATTGNAEPKILSEKVVTSSTPPTPPAKESLVSRSAVLHTYTQDVQSLVRDRKISLISAVAAESDRAGRVNAEQSSTRGQGSHEARKSNFMLIASIILVMLGSAALAIGYIGYNLKQQALERDKRQVITDDTLIFIEHRVRVDITDRLPRETLSELAQLQSSSQATLGSITQVLLQNKVWDPRLLQKVEYTVNAQELVKALGLSFPNNITQYLGGDYMLGMHMADKNSPFVLFSTRSYDHAFAGLLEWERAAGHELEPFFYDGAHSGVSPVENAVIQNIDARVMRDETGTIKVLYAFLDNNTFIITNNIYTLTEVARRYQVRKTAGTGGGL